MIVAKSDIGYKRIVKKELFSRTIRNIRICRLVIIIAQNDLLLKNQKRRS